MNDSFVCKLFSDVFQKMGISLKASPSVLEYHLLVEAIHPVMLRYDPATERILLISTLDLSGVREEARPPLIQRMLQAGLNPLRSTGPGIGYDEDSGLYFSYIMLSRYSVTTDEICQEIIGLVEWSLNLPSQ